MAKPINPQVILNPGANVQSAGYFSIADEIVTAEDFFDDFRHVPCPHLQSFTTNLDFHCAVSLAYPSLPSTAPTPQLNRLSSFMTHRLLLRLASLANWCLPTDLGRYISQTILRQTVATHTTVSRLTWRALWLPSAAIPKHHDIIFASFSPSMNSLSFTYLRIYTIHEAGVSKHLYVVTRMP